MDFMIMKERYGINSQLHGKNNFAEISKNLAEYKSKKKFWTQNYCVRRHNEQCCKKYDILINLGVLHNYFDSLKIIFRSS